MLTHILVWTSGPCMNNVFGTNKNLNHLSGWNLVGNWSRIKAHALTKDFSQLCVNFLFFIPE